MKSEGNNEQICLLNIKNEVFKVMNEYGLRTAFSYNQTVRKNKSEEPITLWSNIQDQIFGENVTRIYNNILTKGSMHYYLENIPKLFSFGYLMGYGLSNIFDANLQEKIESGIVSGLLNIWISLFDKICDDYPFLIRNCVKIVNADSIGKLFCSYYDNEVYRELDANKNDHVLIRILCKIIAEYIRRCANAQMKNKNSQMYFLLKDMILELIDNELKSLECKLSSHISSKCVLEILKKKSAWPFLAIYMNTYLCMSETEEIMKSKYRDVLLKLGKAIWIVDDIADLFEDLDNNNWNYVWLKSQNRKNIRLFKDNGFLRSKRELTNDLVNSGTIRMCANDMCRNFRSSFLTLNRRDDGDLECYVKVIINDWLGYSEWITY